MGKRELLLFLGFLLFGGVVYQVTAPPKEESKQGFSFSKFVDKVQAEIRGERAETAVERTASADAPSGEGRLVIPEYRGTLTIVGEADRHELAAQLKAIVYGMDDDQSKARAKDMNIGFEEHGDDITLNLVYPNDVHRRPQVDVTLRVPAHLGVKLELRGGQADLRQVREVILQNSRGKITMADMGDASGEFENGSIEIVHAQAVKLETRRAQVRLEEIAGELTLESEHGELRLQQIHGPTKLVVQRIDCEIDGLHGSTTIEPTHANLSVRNIAAPLTVKGDDTEVRATMASAVDVTIETTNDDIELRAPREGVTIDAKTESGGQIRVADAHDSSGEEEPDAVERPEKTEPPEPPAPPEPPEPSDRPGGQPPKPPTERPRRLERLRDMRGGTRTESRTESRTQSDGDQGSREMHTTIKLHGGGPVVSLRNTRGDIIIR